MEGNHKRETAEQLAKALVAIELEMTDNIGAEYRRLRRHHRICVELTARAAWSEVGPLIDREVARLRQEFALPSSGQGSTRVRRHAL